MVRALIGGEWARPGENCPTSAAVMGRIVPIASGGTGVPCAGTRAGEASRLCVGDCAGLSCTGVLQLPLLWAAANELALWPTAV